MPSRRYRVVSDGKILEGQKIQEVKRNLATLFKVSEKKIEPYFVGRPIVIKKNVDYQTAVKYEKAFRSAGAICTAEPVESYPSPEPPPMTDQQEAPEASETEIIICPKCGFEQERSEECIHCGIIIEKYVEKVSTPATQIPPQIEEKDFKVFIGKNAYKYMSKFRKFNTSGSDSFAVTWHWPAFFLGPLWMLYRKLYLWALIAFVVDFIPVICFIAWIAWGMTGNYIYYKHAKRKTHNLIASHLTSDISSSLSQIGGVNQWVVTFVKVCVAIAIIGIIAAIFIPMIAGVRS